MDATLKELTGLIKEVNPESRRSAQAHNKSFWFNLPDLTHFNNLLDQLLWKL